MSVCRTSAVSSRTAPRLRKTDWGRTTTPRDTSPWKRFGGSACRTKPITYLCGQSAFLRTFTQDLTNEGVASSQLHQEVFGPEESRTPGIAKRDARAAHVPAGAAGPGPMVSFARSGLDAPWNPSYRSLLEFAEACDVRVKWSCRTGVCHTCECAIIDGSVDYDPEPLEPPAEGNVLICCARPEVALQLDL